MPVQSFSDTLKEAAVENPAFADHLFEDAVSALFAGEIDEGRLLLRAHVNATIGFEELGRLTNRNAKSLMRMLGAKGNPTAGNLFGIIAELGRARSVRIEAHVTKATSSASV